MEQSSIETMRSKTKLHHEGVLYVYDKMSASGDIKFWRCEFSNARDVRCKGRLHTDLNGTVQKVFGEHICPSSAARVESQRIITAIKRRAIDTMESTDEILSHALQNVSPSVLAAVPSKNAANKLIKRARTENKGTAESFKHLESFGEGNNPLDDFDTVSAGAHSVALTLTIDADGQNYGEHCQQTRRSSIQFPSVVVHQHQQQQQIASTSNSSHSQQQQPPIRQQRVSNADFSATNSVGISNFGISPTHSVPIVLDSNYLPHGVNNSSAVDSMPNAIGGGGPVAVSSSIAYSSPIDNKIEQALDLVKTQLTLAVRKEMKHLRCAVVELESKVSLLESENHFLRQYVPGEVEANLPALVQQMRDRQQKTAVNGPHKYSNQQQSRISSSSILEHQQQNAATVAQTAAVGASATCSSVADSAWGDGRVKASVAMKSSDFGRNGL